MINCQPLLPAVFLLSLLAIPTPALSAEMSGKHYAIESAVLAGGGGSLESSGYQLDGTLGQPSPPGTATGAHYELLSGFWASSSISLVSKAYLPAVYLLLLDQ